MKKMLEHLINVVQKKELELLFGKDSKVIVESISYSTNNKSYVIHTKVFATNIDDYQDIFPTGLNMLVEESWKYTGINEKITTINSLDVI